MKLSLNIPDDVIMKTWPTDFSTSVDNHIHTDITGSPAKRASRLSGKGPLCWI